MRNKPGIPRHDAQGRDGSYLWAKRDNEKRQKELRAKFENALGSAKKTLKSKPVSLTETKGNLYLQFSTKVQYDGSIGEPPIRSKYSIAQYLGISKCADSVDAVNSALEVGLKVAKELESGSFTWDNYVCWIKGDLPEHLKNQVARTKTCKELIEEFKAHYWATHDFSTEEKAHKSERTWKHNYQGCYSKLPQDKKLNLEAVKQVLSHYDPSKNTYRQRLTALKALISYHKIKLELEQFEFEGETEQREGEYLEPERIIEGWRKIKHFKPAAGRKSKHQDLYAWMYGMMAVYGLRNHEVLNIQNLDKPFKVPNESVILPAFNDPNNEDKYIYTYGKTGKRTQTMPLPIEWIKLFELENIPDFPVFDNGRQKDNFLSSFTCWCRATGHQATIQKIDFYPYDLRHSYAMRCRIYDINPLDAKDCMGHSMEMQEKIYQKGFKVSNLIKSAKKYQQRIKEKPELSENDLLRLENQRLKEQVSTLTQKIETLLEKLSEKE